MEATDILQSLFRWIHVVAGIIWIGLLYFFNWVNGPFVALLDGDTKKKVIPELMPRALFWFRWGAAWTWMTGILLLTIVFYHGGLLFESPGTSWTALALVASLIPFVGVFIYEGVMKTIGKKNIKMATGIGFVLIAAFVALMVYGSGFSYRSYVIHLGTALGTIMAFNVWFRIWPAQQKIITAVKNSEKPDADLVAMAGMRSKNNTYFSVPLVWTMLNAHTTWASSYWWILLVVILVAWQGTAHLYKKAGKVKGF